jgi:putative FmdB family regulatory protein
MPFYEFCCATCGPFQEWRSMSESLQPALCHSCQAAAARVFTPPNVYRTSPSYRKARYLEEKSAHEPEVVIRNQPPQETEAGSLQRPRPIVSRHPWAAGPSV